MAHAPECSGRIYSCPKCGRRELTIEETFDHHCTGTNADPLCPNCGTSDLLFGVDELDREDGTFVCENCDSEGRLT